jgi:hypothetical protein
LPNHNGASTKFLEPKENSLWLVCGFRIGDIEEAYELTSSICNKPISKGKKKTHFYIEIYMYIPLAVSA